MTPFDYDPNFADPSARSPAGIRQGAARTALARVWGCKRPELLITETLAFHDRRTDDTALSNPTTQHGEQGRPDP